MRLKLSAGDKVLFLQIEYKGKGTVDNWLVNGIISTFLCILSPHPVSFLKRFLIRFFFHKEKLISPSLKESFLIDNLDVLSFT